MISPTPCQCQQPPFRAADFRPRHLGVDESDGRFADVALLQCLHCASWWLEYHFSIEAFAESGRWYRVEVAAEEVSSLHAGNAVARMEKAESHFVGGSYFRSSGLAVKGGVTL